MQQSRRLCAAASPLHRARAGDARNRRVQPQRTRGDANRLANAAAGLRLFLYDARCRVGARMIVPKRSRSMTQDLSLIHISEPTRLLSISYAVFCLKKK